MSQTNQKAATFAQLTIMAQAAKNYADAHGKIEAIKVNNETLTIDGNKAVNITVPTDLLDLTNTPGFQTASQVESAINAKVSSVYKPGGTKTAAELTSALLIAANEGRVYSLTTALTLTAANKSLFVENADGSYPAGTNVEVFEATPATYTPASGTAQEGVTYYSRSGEEAPYTYTPVSIETGESVEGSYVLTDPVYKFDILSGYIDLSGYTQKVPDATAGHLASLNADGSVNDSGVALATDVEVTSMLTEVFGADAIPSSGD